MKDVETNPAAAPTWRRIRNSRTGLACLVLLFAALALRAAWVCDDAYITLRTVDNFVHGLGLTWNPPDRVQTFTHPLWLFLLAPFYALTGEAFHTAIFLGLAISIGAVSLLVFRFGRSFSAAFAPLLVLILSRAFIDYSTAGMENPLTHLSLALFLIVYFAHADEGGSAAGSRLPGAGVPLPGGGTLAARRASRRITLLALFAALGALTRLDTLLLFLPPLGLAFFTTLPRMDPRHDSARPRRYHAGRAAWVRALAALALGFLPLVAWEVSSLIYYGFLLPNTAYAKLSTGIPAGELLAQGGRYFLYTLRFDPLTLVAIAAGMAMPWIVMVRGAGSARVAIDATWNARNAHRSTLAAAVSVGIFLYVLYVAKIGGDFMGGRFFTAPLFASIALLLVLPDAWRRAVGAPARPDPAPSEASDRSALHLPLPALVAALVVLALGLAPRIGLTTPAAAARIDVIDSSLARTDAGSDAQPSGVSSSARSPGNVVRSIPSPIQPSGIADERAFYALEGRTLFKPALVSQKPRIFSAEQGRALRARGGGVILEGAIGELGFHAGPRIRIVDYFGLADPLLARLPALQFDPFLALSREIRRPWRIGHFLRAIPEGYLESVSSGENRLRNPALRDQYDRLLSIVRGPLWSARRFAEIWRINTSGRRGRIAEMSRPTMSDSISATSDTVRVSFNGLRVVLPGIAHASSFQAHLDAGDSYLIVYYRGGAIAGAQQIPASAAPKAAGRSVTAAPELFVACVAIPFQTAQEGFDAMGFFPLRGDGLITIGPLAMTGP